MVKLTAVIKKDQDTRVYSAWCPEVDVASQGESMEKALENLKEALELYFEDEDTESYSDEVMVTVVDIPDKAEVKT